MKIDLDKDITFKRNNDFLFEYSTKGLLNNLKRKEAARRGTVYLFLTKFCTYIVCKTKKDVTEVLS